MKKQSLRMRAPDDFHLHLREGEQLKLVAPLSAQHFARGLVMPNTKRPIATAEDAGRYEREIYRATTGSTFELLMTIKLTMRTTPDEIRQCAKEGVVACKLYPEGVTTNSDDGIPDIRDISDDVFAALIEHRIMLCVHGEQPGVYTPDREKKFLQRLGLVLRRHKRLRVVIEHITTRDAIAFVQTERMRGKHVGATITVHHLFLTLDDVIGGTLKPHLFCKPVAKRREDRDALVEFAMSGDPAFFLGTDSAPHPVERKECNDCCAGVFTAPIAIPLLAGLFDQHDRLNRLEAFTSKHGADFYGLPKNKGHIELRRRPRDTHPREAWTVPALYQEQPEYRSLALHQVDRHENPLVYGLDPDQQDAVLNLAERIGGVVPFKAGSLLHWRVEHGRE